MVELTAVARDAQGRRFELTLTALDEFGPVLATNDAEGRLQLMLQRDVTRASEILNVASRDAHDEAKRRAEGRHRKSVEAGPDQIAFAGTKTPAVEVASPKAEER